MMSQVQRETEKFFDHVYKLHLHAFPLNSESDIDVELDLNADNNTGIIRAARPISLWRWSHGAFTPGGI